MVTGNPTIRGGTSHVSTLTQAERAAANSEIRVIARKGLMARFVHEH